MVSEKPWVRVPVGPRSFSALVIFGGSVWVRARGASSKGTVSSVSGMVPSGFGDESN